MSEMGYTPPKIAFLVRLSKENDHAPLDLWVPYFQSLFSSGVVLTCCRFGFLPRPNENHGWHSWHMLTHVQAERTCHSMVHRTFSHSELGRNYNSIEAGFVLDKQFSRAAVGSTYSNSQQKKNTSIAASYFSTRLGVPTSNYRESMIIVEIVSLRIIFYLSSNMCELMFASFCVCVYGLVALLQVHDWRILFMRLPYGPYPMIHSYLPVTPGFGGSRWAAEIFAAAWTNLCIRFGGYMFFLGFNMFQDVFHPYCGYVWMMIPHDKYISVTGWNHKDP